ncbi:MAG: hypothetical protein ACLR7D_17160 [Lachnospira eligens]
MQAEENRAQLEEKDSQLEENRARLEEKDAEIDRLKKLLEEQNRVVIYNYYGCSYHMMCEWRIFLII